MTDSESVIEGSPEALIARLATASWSTRRELVSALALRGSEALGPLLAALSSQRDDEGRIAALVDALVASTAEVEPALVALIDQSSEQVLADVAQILGRRRNTRSVTTLVELTKHADDNVAVAAIEALGRVGGHGAVDALIACVESRCFFRTFPAIDVLGRTGDPRAVAPLARLLETPRYALEAARALGRTADRSAALPLASLLSSSSLSTVRVGCAALDELLTNHAARYGDATAIELTLRHVRSPAVVRRLGHALDDAERPERAAICRVLAALRDPEAIPLLTQLLDGDPEIATAASRALREIGSDAEAAIDDALRAPHGARRQVLLPELTSLRQSPAAEACLDDPDPQVRTLAANTLARLGSVAATPALFRLLDDESAQVVHAASAAIQALGSDRTEELALEAARSSRVETRRAALRILGYFGYASALDPLEQALDDPDPRVRSLAVQGLGWLDVPRARQRLLATTTHDDARLRAAAIRALGQCPPEPETVERLCTALDDDDAWVRYYACQALGRLRVVEAVEPIIGRLLDAAGQVRVAAIEALSHIPSEAALAALRRASHDPDLDLQRAALLGLGLAHDETAIARLAEAAGAGDAATRLVALSALASFEGPEVVASLSEAARDDDPSVRSAAIGFLASAAGEAPTEALIALLAGGAEDERLLEALARPHEGRVDAIGRALAAADDELAPKLASTLVRLHNPAALSALDAALSSPNRAARIAVANGLAALGTREAFASLARAARDDPDPDVRRVCALHLAG